MRIGRDTPLYVVGDHVTNRMCLQRVVEAIQGGIDLESLKIFTEPEEAKRAENANARRETVGQFSDDDLLRAVQVVLLDEDGQRISKIEFCPF